MENKKTKKILLLNQQKKLQEKSQESYRNLSKDKKIEKEVMLTKHKYVKTKKRCQNKIKIRQTT